MQILVGTSHITKIALQGMSQMAPSGFCPDGGVSVSKVRHHLDLMLYRPL